MRNDTLDICIYPTSVRIQMCDEYTAKNGVNINEFLTSLTEYSYNFRIQKWLINKRYALYEPGTQVASFPRYYLKYLVDYMKYHHKEVNLIYADTDTGRDVQFTLNPWWKPRESQIPAIEFLVGKDNPHCMRALPLQTGQGKGQPSFSKIKVPGGWSTMGDMQIGTVVSTPDGKTGTVNGIYPQGMQKCYRFILEDGRSTICDENHLWKIYHRQYDIEKKDSWNIYSTRQILDQFNNRYIPVSSIENGNRLLRIRSIEYIGEMETQCISIDHPDHLYITDDDIVTHNTFSSLTAMAHIGKASIIILNGMIDQWYDVILNGRNGKPPVYHIDPSELYVIQGQKSLVDLIDNVDYKPSVIIASLPTIRNYIAAQTPPYDTMMPFGYLMKRLGIGTKINDEAHQAFSAIVDIDLRSNIHNNIYLSATLTRGDKESRKIFKRVFPDIIKYGDAIEKRYVQVFYHSYTLGYIPENQIVHGKYGYNHLKYENYILDRVHLKIAYCEVIASYFYSYYLTIKKPGQKCLILVSKRDMGDVVHEYLASMYPDQKISTYYGGNDISILSDFDVIISTSKKGSTGTDIDNLKTMINTLSIGSDVLLHQSFGRLRELKNDETPVYVAMYNEILLSHYNHYLYARRQYSKRALQFNDLTTKRELV